MRACTACPSRAQYRCPKCSTPFCGAKCYIGTQHLALVCGGVKREREQLTLDEFIALIKEDKVEQVRNALDSGLSDDHLRVEYATSPEMVRLLVRHGADVYAYLGNGQWTLDLLVQRMNVREFLVEATMPVPDWLQTLLDETRNVTEASLPLYHIMTLDDVRLLLFHGFVPEFILDMEQPNYALFASHLIFRRYNDQTLRFWNPGVDQTVEEEGSAMYMSIERMKQRAYETASSLMLLLFAPEHVYKQSKRPVNNMEMFKGVKCLHHSLAERQRVTNVPYIPVTRYARGMSHGLYYTDADADSSSFCGTFYYMEPESTTYLLATKVFRAKTKTDAFNALISKISSYITRKQLKAQLEEPSLDERNLLEQLKDSDLMFTPAQFEEFRRSANPYVQKAIAKHDWTMLPLVQPRPYYCAHVLGLYAAEDYLDQAVCNAARERNVRVVVFERVVGSHQIVTEVLDVRPRQESFRNLCFRKG